MVVSKGIWMISDLLKAQQEMKERWTNAFGAQSLRNIEILEKEEALRASQSELICPLCRLNRSKISKRFGNIVPCKPCYDRKRYKKKKLFHF